MAQEKAAISCEEKFAFEHFQNDNQKYYVARVSMVPHVKLTPNRKALKEDETQDLGFLFTQLREDPYFPADHEEERSACIGAISV